METMHPSTMNLLRFFEHIQVTDDDKKQQMNDIRDIMGNTAGAAIHLCPEGPELTAGLRKLLEAKDCFVRAVL